MRIATPAFQLFMAPLTQAVEQGRTQTFREQVQKFEYMSKLKFPDNSLPIGLRWNMHPEFGFPRKPFNVFRRRSVYTGFTPVSLLSDNVTLANTSRDFSFPVGQEMYISIVNVSLTTGQTLTVTPFDRDHKPMTGKSRTVTASGLLVFKCPFTAGFTISGSGSINTIAGISMQQMLDAKDWELIQIVGLPFNTGQVGGQGYDGDNQGYVGMLTDAKTAALQRLKIGELLFMKPPANGDTQVPDPNWQPVDSELYLDDLFNAPVSILKLIDQCMTVSDDTSFFRTQRQPAYVDVSTIKGIHQPGGGPPKPAEAKVPVVGTTLLSVGTESPAALGLGFGTTDFPGTVGAGGGSNTGGINTHVGSFTHAVIARAASTVSYGFDYMVTAQYIVRPYENFNPLSIFDDISKKIEFCALSDERELPTAPVNAEAITLRVNRPEKTDEIFTEALKLRWNKALSPQGCGVIVSYKNGQSSVLNAAYDFSVDAYKNFNTYVPKAASINPDEQVLPAEDAGDGEKFVLTEPEEPLPFKGNELHKYFVAGWDVFGRWSNFVKVPHIASAPPSQQPGIMSIRLNKTNPDITSDLSPTNPNVSCTLELELGWYWSDRTPSKMQVSGLFFDASDSVPPATHPDFFALTATDITTPVITITLDTLGNPTTSAGNVFMVDNPADTPSDLRKIKLVIDNITASFPNGSPFAVAYAVYVRGLETVRVTPLPEDWSNWSDGYVSRMEDPRPPDVTTLPASVLYTALPDCTKLGRGRLSWPAAANALGYYVWEASEIAVRAALSSQVELLDLTESHVARATELRDLLAQPQYQNLCQRYFNKLSKEMITGTSVELEIPASNKGLTLYQVSSINTANIESGKSNVIFFAVPQLRKPGPPMLTLRKFKREDPVTHAITRGIQVQLLNGNGVEPEGFNLYRTRKVLIGNDVGTKGLPVLEYDSTDWQPHSMRMPDGKLYDGKLIEETIAAGSWRPYVYQAVAVGTEDTDRGFFRGESDPSSTQIIFYPPDGPPILLLQPPILNNGQSRVLVLRTDAPFDLIEIGKTIVELYDLDTSNNRTLIKTFLASATPINDTDLMPGISPAIDEWPAISRRKTDVTTGITQFSIGIKATVNRLIVRVIDPSGRATEAAEPV